MGVLKIRNKETGQFESITTIRGEKGDAGNGIASAILNADYTLTLNFTDGTKYTTPSIRGATGGKGDTGPQGVSVTKVEQTTTSSADGGTNVITVTLSNGQNFSFNVKNGSKGSQGNPGVGIQSVTQTTTSSEDGGSNVVTVTKTDGTSSTFTIKNGSKGSQGPKGSDATVTSANIKSALGYTPANAETVSQLSEKIESDAYQEDIVQQVIVALGTPVYGRVDEDCNIVLTGELTSGKTYSFAFVEKDGNRVLIGTYYKEAEPTWTNVIPLSINADGTQFVGTNGEDGYKTGTRLNSSGGESSANTVVTGYIPATVADKFYFCDIDLSVDSNKYHRIAIYDENFTQLGYWDMTGMYSAKDESQVIAEGVSFDENGRLVTYSPLAYRFVVGSTVVNKTAYIRVCAGTINENSIITKNEPIK